jgi:hypothetical protein
MAPDQSCCAYEGGCFCVHFLRFKFH